MVFFYLEAFILRTKLSLKPWIIIIKNVDIKKLMAYTINIVNIYELYAMCKS